MSDGAIPPLVLHLYGPFEVRVNGALLPRLRSHKGCSLLILACPSSPFSHPRPGIPGGNVPVQVPGANSEGWTLTPTQTMQISYSMNSCAATWIPADRPKETGPPTRLSQVTRPADTIIICIGCQYNVPKDSHFQTKDCLKYA